MNRSAAPIAFLFPAFPNLHQTFVLWEVLALRERGVPIALYSIKRPSTATQQPEARALAPEVCYLPPPFAPAVLQSNLRALFASPGRYVRLYLRLAREWWRERDAGRDWKRRQISDAAPEREHTLREKLSGRFNRSPFLFLLKSLWLVPVAVHFGHLATRRGITRVHAHWASYSTTVALVARWFFGLRFSFTAHAYDIYLVPRLLGVKVREADLVITCARVNARFLRSLAGEGPPERIVVNYHGVDLDRFSPPERRPPREPPCLVTCGRLEPYKGHHVLLRAVAKLKRPVRCVVIGEGPQRERLAALAQDLGIADRVELAGPLPQAELARRYAQADLFVLASVIAEGSGKRDVIPNVLAEAMAMRLPVIASDISGIGELITDGQSGRLVPANDPDALAAAIEELLDDPARRDRLAAAGREKVMRDFDRSKNVVELARLFSESHG